MLFRVASRVGMSVERMLAEMPADEFFGWCAFYDLEPWGFQAERVNAGIVAAEVSNWAGRTRKRMDAKASDWIPKTGKPARRRMSQQEMRARVKSEIEKAKSDG